MQLITPSADIAELTDQLGQAWGIRFGEPIVQYIAWAEKAGIFSVLSSQRLTLEQLADKTTLSDAGIDALVSILLSLSLVLRREDGLLFLSTLAQEYLNRKSPYYIGAGLYWGCSKEIPHAYRQQRPGDCLQPEARKESEISYQLRVQHSRNFGPGVVAARTGQFDKVSHLVDIGGGSGVFAIPLALDHPAMQITLVDLPECLPPIRNILSQYGLSGRVRLVGMDALTSSWHFPSCDGILFGNFLHGFSDQDCLFFVRKSFDAMGSEGKLWVHEVLFDENHVGPMIAALWNANMRMVGGRQRSYSEFQALVKPTGFVSPSVLTTAGRYSLIRWEKRSG